MVDLCEPSRPQPSARVDVHDRWHAQLTSVPPRLVRPRRRDQRVSPFAVAWTVFPNDPSEPSLRLLFAFSGSRVEKFYASCQEPHDVVSMKLPHVSRCSEDRSAAAACVLRAEGEHASLRPHICAIRGCVGKGATWPFAAKVHSEVLSFRNSSKHFLSIAMPTQLVTRPREDRKCL